MSQPLAGSYYIINGPILPGEKEGLALTFNGNGAPLTVTEKGSRPGQQVWNVGPPGENTQLVHLQEQSVIRPNPWPNNMIVGGTGGSTWAIRGRDNVYTISMGDLTNYWGLLGEQVNYGPETGNVTQSWTFVLA